MPQRVLLPVAVGLAPLWAVVCGCGDTDQVVELTYNRQAEFQLPAKVRRIGVAEFGGKTEMDERWGNVAADELVAALDEYNRKFDRYELVDRKRLKAIMDERDLQIAISDTSSAVELGKLADVDAMIYGNVSVMARDERASKMVFDPLSQSLQPRPYVKRYCMAAVNFTMDDIMTGRTLASVQVSHDYDSEEDEDASSLGKAFGVGLDKRSPIDQVCAALIRACVDEFLCKVSPHQVTVREFLRHGRTKVVQTGNKLAAAGEYREALDCYQQGLEANPKDDGALFNAGLMHEALGDLARAEACYDKAFKLKDEEKYVMARARVRRELGRCD